MYKKVEVNEECEYNVKEYVKEDKSIGIQVSEDDFDF